MSALELRAEAISGLRGDASADGRLGRRTSRDLRIEIKVRNTASAQRLKPEFLRGARELIVEGGER